MSLLPKKLRFGLFDTLSLKTMRYVDAVPRSKAKGLTADVYRQICEDFFINGSLTNTCKMVQVARFQRHEKMLIGLLRIMVTSICCNNVTADGGYRDG
ncbi:MAG: hypothetical protein V7731_08085 [Amphritea sp.]